LLLFFRPTPQQQQQQQRRGGERLLAVVERSNREDDDLRSHSVKVVRQCDVGVITDTAQTRLFCKEEEGTKIQKKTNLFRVSEIQKKKKEREKEKERRVEKETPLKVVVLFCFNI
jgi:hypothetical protein